jgi:hypothetical protein
LVLPVKPVPYLGPIGTEDYHVEGGRTIAHLNNHDPVTLVADDHFHPDQMSRQHPGGHPQSRREPGVLAHDIVRREGGVPLDWRRALIPAARWGAYLAALTATQSNGDEDGEAIVKTAAVRISHRLQR